MTAPAQRPAGTRALLAPPSQTDLEMTMELGELITALEAADPTLVCKRGFNNPHSYRGYYHELAFEPAHNITVGEMLAAARSAVGATYTGWKGGEFTMDRYSDVWLSEEGHASGDAISGMLIELMIAQAQQPFTATSAPADRYQAAWRNARARAKVLSDELTRRAPLLGEYAAENTKLHQWHDEDRTALTEMRATIVDLRAASDDRRLSLSVALGLGTGAPWDAIRERAAELQAVSADRASMYREAADALWRAVEEKRIPYGGDFVDMCRDELLRLADEAAGGAS
ncbi:hypothetical protein [Streptomyces sp. SGAir0957]